MGQKCLIKGLGNSINDLFYFYFPGGQKRVLNSLQLGLQVVLSPLMWVLGVKFGLSTKATSSLTN